MKIICVINAIPFSKWDTKDNSAERLWFLYQHGEPQDPGACCARFCADILRVQKVNISWGWLIKRWLMRPQQSSYVVAGNVHVLFWRRESLEAGACWKEPSAFNTGVVSYDLP